MEKPFPGTVRKGKGLGAPDRQPGVTYLKLFDKIGIY
jgi:hypothetical protein